MTTARKPAPKRSSEIDAITLLKADHDKVRELFKQFEELMDKEEAEEQKGVLAQKICNELKVHAQIEEEIFYPTVRAAIDDDELMDEADVEHEAVKELIEQIEAMRPSDDLYDAKVVVLGLLTFLHFHAQLGDIHFGPLHHREHLIFFFRSMVLNLLA